MQYIDILSEMTIHELLEELVMLVKRKAEGQKILMVKEEITLRVPEN